MAPTAPEKLQMLRYAIELAHPSEARIYAVYVIIDQFILRFLKIWSEKRQCTTGSENFRKKQFLTWKKTTKKC